MLHWIGIGVCLGIGIMFAPMIIELCAAAVVGLFLLCWYIVIACAVVGGAAALLFYTVDLLGPQAGVPMDIVFVLAVACFFSWWHEHRRLARLNDR